MREFEESAAEQPPCPGWAPLVLLAAIGFSFLSLIGRPDSLNEVHEVCWFSFLLVGPLWAMVAAIFFAGRLRTFLVTLALILPASGISLFHVWAWNLRTTVSRCVLTQNTMRMTLVRIHEFIRKHRKVPPDLSFLPMAEESIECSLDGWGRPLRYSVDPDGVISIRSFGADGKSGGERSDTDIVMRYRTRNSDGTLNVDDEDWIFNARIE